MITTTQIYGHKLNQFSLVEISLNSVSRVRSKTCTRLDLAAKIDLKAIKLILTFWISCAEDQRGPKSKREDLIRTISRKKDVFFYSEEFRGIPFDLLRYDYYYYY